MTREDVIEEAYVNDFFKVIKWAEDDYEFDFEPVREFLNELYDDVESRVCKNCKYFRTNYAPTCGLGIISEELFGNGVVSKDFGCNRFKRKEIK